MDFSAVRTIAGNMVKSAISRLFRNIAHNKTLWAGLAAGVLGHILQGMMAFLFFDRFYLAHAELLRDVSHAVGLYYLVPNLIVGVIISYLTMQLKKISARPNWQVGGMTGVMIWAASSAVVIVKRQIIFDLSNWLLLEIISDLFIFAFMGALAGFLTGHGDVEKE